MSKKTIFTLITAVALVAVAGVGLLTYQSVYAQTSPTPSAPANPQAGPGFGRGMRGGMMGENGAFQQQLASALGITSDQLTTAYQSANAEALKQAVSQGLITQDQAAAMAARGMFPRGLGANSGIDYEALLAQALNITTGKLQAAEKTAEAAVIDAAVQAGNLTQQQGDAIKARQALSGDTNFQSAMTTAFENAVKQAVTDGVITQAQADALLAQQQQNGGLFGRMFGGHGFGGGKHGGWGGFFGGNGTNNQAAPAPTTAPTSSSGL